MELNPPNCQKFRFNRGESGNHDVTLPSSSERSATYLQTPCLRIALLSDHGEAAIDPPSQRWLGHHCTRQRVQSSGLWNNKYIDEPYDPSFLSVLEQYIEAMPSSSPCEIANRASSCRAPDPVIQLLPKCHRAVHPNGPGVTPGKRANAPHSPGRRREEWSVNPVLGSGRKAPYQQGGCPHWGADAGCGTIQIHHVAKHLKECRQRLAAPLKLSAKPYRGAIAGVGCAGRPQPFPRTFSGMVRTSDKWDESRECVERGAWERNPKCVA